MIGVRIVVVLLLALSLVGQDLTQQIPPVTFSGAVHGVSKKHITIETAEGNLLDFDITGKTHVLRGKKKIEADSLQEGENVKIEAKQEPARAKQFLEALTITVSPPPAK